MHVIKFWQKKLNCKYVWMSLKLDIDECWSKDMATTLCIVMTLVLISFCCFFFTQYVTISSRVLLHSTMLFRITNCLKMRCSVSSKTLRNKRNAMAESNKLNKVVFLHLDLVILIIWRKSFSSTPSFKQYRDY